MTYPLRACPSCGHTRPARRHGLCQSCGTRAGMDRATLDTVAPAPDWALAACRNRGTDAWFPAGDAPKPANWGPARAVCMSCPLLDACGSWALGRPDPTHGEGMWGGMTPDERAHYRQITRTNQEAAA